MGMSLVMASCQTGKKEQTKENAAEEHLEGTEMHDHGSDLATAPYQCPMQCEGEKTYPEPGSCPVCKMDLKEVIQEPEVVADEEGQTAE